MERTCEHCGDKTKGIFWEGDLVLCELCANPNTNGVKNLLVELFGEETTNEDNK